MRRTNTFNKYNMIAYYFLLVIIHELYRFMGQLFFSKKDIMLTILVWFH
jgi:hypothetical protein